MAERPVAERPVARGSVAVVGIQGGEYFGRAAGVALQAADVVIGARRHLDAVPPVGHAERFAYRTFGELLDLVEEHLAREANVGVLASGDPGFFGAARVLIDRFGDRVSIHPAPSAVALAFARVGLAWDDAVVVSAHGRDFQGGVGAVVAAGKAAVMTSPATPPEAVGRALLGLEEGADRDVWVCTRLGEDDQTVTATDVAGLAAGRFDALSVVIVARRQPPGGDRTTVTWNERGGGGRFGRPVDDFAHRAGMITKPEVRAVVLSKLDLTPGVTLWDVGAGSGSVSVEAAGLTPGLRVWAIERRADDCRRISANAEGLSISVVEGHAPGCFDSLPAPDRAFVGGGGIEVLDAVCARMNPGGMVVASFATLERAAAAAGRLGHLVQIGINRAQSIGSDGAIRLEADNPVFVAWGRR